MHEDIDYTELERAYNSVVIGKESPKFILHKGAWYVRNDDGTVTVLPIEEDA